MQLCNYVVSTFKDWLILLVITLGLISLIFITLDPIDMWLKKRDDQRLENLNKIQDAIEEELEKGGVLQGESGNIFRGDSRSGLRLASSTKNFVGLDLSKHFPILPIDPLNNEKYFYEFISDGVDYEIRCRLEAKKNKFRMVNDGGDNEEYYEVGSKLNLL